MRAQRPEGMTLTDFLKKELDPKDLALMASLWPELSASERKLKAPLLANSPTHLMRWMSSGVEEFGVEPEAKFLRAKARDHSWKMAVSLTRSNYDPNDEGNHYKVGSLSPLQWTAVAARLANPLARLSGPKDTDWDANIINSPAINFFCGPVLAGAGLALCAASSPVLVGAGVAALGARVALALRPWNIDALAMLSAQSSLASFSRLARAKASLLGRKWRARSEAKSAREAAARVDLFDALSRAVAGDEPAPSEVAASVAERDLAQKRQARQEQVRQRLSQASDPSIVFGGIEAAALEQEALPGLKAPSPKSRL